ncbi:MAG: phage holin family protein [Oscillospiraceae bacterium]
MDKIVNVKNGVLAVLAAVGSAAAGYLGGWDAALETLVWCMAADYCTGVMVAGFFKKSPGSADGALSSKAGFRGLCKKATILLAVLVGAQVDTLTGGTYVRGAVIFFFVGNEGLSILENMGLMGVPYPAFLKNALEVLREKGENRPKA